MNPSADKFAQARAAGYSDQEINSYLRSANILSGSNQQSAPAQQPKKKKGGFLTSLLPTIGGTLGAIGGGIAGTFVAPVAGTGAGAAAGGAGGSALGEWLRQKITGDTEAGGGAIAREAAFGAVPAIGKAAKGGMAAIKGAKAAKSANKAREGAASILGKTAIGGTEAEQTARATRLGSNVLSIGQNQANRRANAADNISAMFNNSRRAGVMDDAEQATQFNRLAQENIMRRNAEESGRGIILGDAKGVMMRPGKQPSFAGEGMERRAVPEIPGAKPLTPFDGQATLTPTPKTTATEILNPSPLTQTAVDEARPVNGLARTAERLFGRQTGIQPGAKIGSQVLTAKRATELKDHIRTNIGSKATDAADTILRRNEAFITNKGNELNAILDAKNKPINLGEGSNILAGMKRPTGVDLPNNNTYKALITDAAEIKDLKGLEEFRKNIDEIINFSRSAASPDPIAERVALSARRAIDNYMTKKIPELKPIKGELSKAYETRDFIQPEAAKPQGIRPFGLNVGARTMQSASGAASGLIDKLGSAGAVTGNPMVKQLIGEGMRQGGTRLGAAALLGTPLVGSGMEDTSGELPPQDLLTADLMSGADMSTENMSGMNEDPSANIPMAMQILAMQAAANGDTQQSQAFLAIAKQFETDQKSNAELVKNQAKAQNANSIIDKLEGVFNASGGARGPIAGRATLVGAAAGGGNQTAKAYEELRSAYTAQISRALGEVGVLTDKDREVIQRAIPSINDSEKSKQVKIATLRGILQDLSTRSTSANGSNTTSTQDDAIAALAQMGY